MPYLILLLLLALLTLLVSCVLYGYSSSILLLLLLPAAICRGRSRARPVRRPCGSPSRRPPRLAVPAPTEALLPDAASRTFAVAMAGDLQQQEVPAVAVRVQPGRLAAGHDRGAQRSGAVIPTYTVENPERRGAGHGGGQADPGRAPGPAPSPATLEQAAADAAPSIAQLLTRIEAAHPAE